MKPDNTEVQKAIFWQYDHRKGWTKTVQKYYPDWLPYTQLTDEQLIHIYQSETSQAATPESVEQAAAEYAKGKSSSEVFSRAHEFDFIAGAKWQSEQSPSTSDEIWEQMESDLIADSVPVGHAASMILHWKNKYSLSPSTCKESQGDVAELVKVANRLAANLKIYGDKDNYKGWFDFAFKKEIEILQRFTPKQ